MRVLLPMLVIVPPLLAFMFESPLLDELNKLFQRDEEVELDSIDEELAALLEAGAEGE